MKQIFVGMCTSSEHGIYAPIYQAFCEWCVCGAEGGGCWSVVRHFLGGWPIWFNGKYLQILFRGDWSGWAIIFLSPFYSPVSLNDTCNLRVDLSEFSKTEASKPVWLCTPFNCLCRLTPNYVYLNTVINYIPYIKLCVSKRTYICIYYENNFYIMKHKILK